MIDKPILDIPGVPVLSSQEEVVLLKNQIQGLKDVWSSCPAYDRNRTALRPFVSALNKV